MENHNHNLSEGEFEILALLAKGYSQKEIAAFLNLHESTISSRLYYLARKFDVSGQLNVLRIALIRGILSIDDLRR